MNQQRMFATPSVSQPSRLDATLRMTSNSWVVSLLRRKNSTNPRHTYILVEGIDRDGTGIVRRYDLVAYENRGGLASIVIERHNVPLLDHMGKSVALIVRLDENQDKLYSKSWSITRALAETLDQNIQADTTKKIFYSKLGENALSGSVEGHNCFTWAREKLNGLQDSNITLPEKWPDYIVAHPSLYLPAEATSGNIEATSGNIKCIVM